MALSKRLLSIAKYIIGYKSLADIACDHGYLGIYAAKNYNLEKVLLTDINELPLASAKSNVVKNNLSNIIQTKLGDGLVPLDEAYEVISISGIGGILMKDILSTGLTRAKEAKRLILCPNTDSYEVRKFLKDNNFIIEAEEIVHDYKYYEIIVARYVGQMISYTEKELKYGPILLKEKSDEFINMYNNQLSLLVKQSFNISLENAKETMNMKIKELEEILSKKM